MKKLLLIAALFLTGLLATAKAETGLNHPQGGYFYSALSPHGQWMEIDYGVVVWRPTIVRRTWAPYTQGQWIWTSDGWYWDSYDPFGYITFHYGRWYFDDYYGWIWVPDYEWAPAWVEWRYDDVYIGWAPLPPYAGFSISIGIHYTHNYYTPYHHWHYVKYNNFCSPYVGSHFVGSKYKYRIHSKTKYRTNYAYRDGRINNYGVDVDYVRERSGGKIRERELERISDPSLIRNNNGGRGSGNERIRTFIAPRKELERENLRDMKIERSDRNTSLQVSKLAVGNREINERRSSGNENRRIETKEQTREEILKENQRKVIERENKSRNVEPPVTSREQERKLQENNSRNIKQRKIEERNNERNVNVETPKKIEQRKTDVQKSERNERTNTNRSNQIRTETKERIELNSAPNRNQEIQKRNDVKNERKVESTERKNRNETRSRTESKGRSTERNTDRGRR